MALIAPMLFVFACWFGYYFDPEKAKEFAFLLGGFTPTLYALFTTFLQRKTAGHGLGFVTLNGFGFSPLTSFVTIGMFVLALAIYFISLALRYERWEIYGFCIIIALMLSTISWKCRYYYISWHGSEDDARVDFEDYAFGKDDMNRYMEELRKRKLIL